MRDLKRNYKIGKPGGTKSAGRTEKIRRQDRINPQAGQKKSADRTE
jgi:hypothetical protein